MAERHSDNRGRGAIDEAFRPARAFWEAVDWVARAWAVVLLLGAVGAVVLLLAKRYDGSVDLIACVACASIGAVLLKMRDAPSVVGALGFFAVLVALTIAFHGPIEEAVDGPAGNTRRPAASLAGNPTVHHVRRTLEGTSPKAPHAAKVSRSKSRRSPSAAASSASTGLHSESSASLVASSVSAASRDEGVDQGVRHDHTPSTTTRVESPHEDRVPHAIVEEAREASPAKAEPAVKVGSASEASHGPVIESN
jgi:hypothetical protein